MKFLLDGEFNVFPHEVQLAETFILVDLPSFARIQELTLKNLPSKIGEDNMDFFFHPPRTTASKCGELIPTFKDYFSQWKELNLGLP